jgi:hypothetical protein
MPLEPFDTTTSCPDSGMSGRTLRSRTRSGPPPWHATQLEVEPVTVATYDEQRLPGILAIFEAEGYVNYLANAQLTHRVLTAPGTVTLVALDGNEQVVGVIQVQGDDHIQGHVSLFAVATEWRRRGVGTRFFTTALSRSGCMRLDLLSTTKGQMRSTDRSPIGSVQASASIRTRSDLPGHPHIGGSAHHQRLIRTFGPHVSQERAAEMAARTLALPDAQSVEDLTALLTSAGER